MTSSTRPTKAFEAMQLYVVLGALADDRGDLELQTEDMGDDAFVDLVDSYATDAHPMVQRLQALMAERGWAGWSRLERTVSDR